MSYGLKWQFSVVWIGDGVGPMEVPSAQVLTVTQASPSGGGVIPIPGGDAPSTGNISTACSSAATAGAAVLNANIAQIQGFATGGG